TDPDKKAEFIILANKAAKKAEEIKRKVKNNPIAQLANFNYLDDLRALAQGNVPPNVCPDRQPGGGGSNSNNNNGGGGNGSGQTPNPLEEPKTDRIVNGKKSSLLGEYQKFANLFPDGDRNEKFYFSRTAPYTIYFPPSLQSYYEKGKELGLEELENPTRGDYEKGLGNNALFYGAPGTGKTETMRNLCVKADKYPLVVVAANWNEVWLTIMDLKERKMSNGLKFLKDCLEGVDKDECSKNLWVFATNHRDQEDDNDDGSDSEDEKEVDIEIVYESVQKPTIEKVLETSLNSLTRIINGKLDEIIEQLEPDEDDGEENIIVKLQAESKRIKKQISHDKKSRNHKIREKSCVAAVGICVASAGAATPFVSAVGGYLIGDKADKESLEREKMLLQDKRYKDAVGEVDKQAQQNNQNKHLIDEIVGKLNGSRPRQSHETDEYLKQQLAIAQNGLKDGENRLNRLKSDVGKLRKELGGGGSLMSLLGLDKLSFADKVIIAGGIVLKREKNTKMCVEGKKTAPKEQARERIKEQREKAREKSKQEALDKFETLSNECFQKTFELGLKVDVRNEELSVDDYRNIKKLLKKLNRAEKQKELEDSLIKEEIKKLQTSLKELEEHVSPRTQDQASNDKSRQRKAKKKYDESPEFLEEEEDLNNKKKQLADLEKKNNPSTTNKPTNYTP
ncbi:12601_t:CDS:10, partial [Racocetra persica]